MQLSEYLKINEISPLAFAEKIGIRGRATIYRYLRHENIPGAKNMARITEATNGAVTPNDFYSEAPQ